VLVRGPGAARERSAARDKGEGCARWGSGDVVGGNDAVRMGATTGHGCGATGEVVGSMGTVRDAWDGVMLSVGAACGATCARATVARRVVRSSCAAAAGTGALRGLVGVWPA
jgi:hypothetical protein